MKAECGPQFDEGRELGLASEDRRQHAAGEAAVAIDVEPVAAVLGKPDGRGDRRGEQGEAAGDEAGVGAMAPPWCAPARGRPG